MFESAARLDREQAAVPLGEVLHSIVMENLWKIDDATWAAAKEAFELCWDQETGWVAMGMAALKINRFTDLMPGFRVAAELHGDKWPILRKVLFLMLVESHKYGEALSVIKLIPITEDLDPSMCSALSILHMHFGAAADAYDLLEGCTQKYGNILQLMNFKAGALYEMGETEAALSVHESVADACTSIDTMVGMGTNMLLMTNCVSRTSERVAASHLEWGRRFASMVNNAECGPRTRGRKRRIGYIGGDFKHHAVTSFTFPLLTMFDSESFAVHVYDNGMPQEADRVSKAISDRVQSYNYVNGLGLDAAVELVLKDDLDLLIDLGGHTSGARLDVMAVKPARKTLTMVGYCNTTGLPNMDYRIVDGITDPPGASDAHCTEKLLRVPGCFLNYMPTVAHDLPDCFKDSRAIPCFAYGCFSKIGKITDAVWNAWGRVLQRRKGSILVIKTKACMDKKTLDRFLARVQKLKIDVSRLHLMPHTGSAKEHVACFNALDVCLDPFPYTSTTIACESLSMGVPIVTLTGDGHRGRVCTSILRNSGFGDWACESLEEYVDKAAGLVPPDKREVRRKFLASAVCDPERYVKKIERCYREVLDQ
jgi:predicted O-linked N-acetylglucosamine transferase (SPINDLY family)